MIPTAPALTGCFEVTWYLRITPFPAKSLCGQHCKIFDVRGLRKLPAKVDHSLIFVLLAGCTTNHIVTRPSGIKFQCFPRLLSLKTEVALVDNWWYSIRSINQELLLAYQFFTRMYICIVWWWFSFRSTHVPNLTDELSTAIKRRLNQFGTAVLVWCGKSVKFDKVFRTFVELNLGSTHGTPSESDVAPVSLQSRTYSVRFGTWKVRRLNQALV